VRDFKLSKDLQFEEKFWDVVGLYLDPPDRALVLCCDEKSQCQALERTQTDRETRRQESDPFPMTFSCRNGRIVSPKMRRNGRH
jgi:hypothetical protein